MDENIQWEYRVESLGSALKGPSDAQIQATLNEWGEEGWEVIAALLHSNSSKLRIVAKRRLSERARRWRSMPR